MRAPGLDALGRQLRRDLREFAREARVRTAMLVNRSGQVLAYHGFDRGLDLAAVASLAASAHSSARALAELTGGAGWTHIHHVGETRELFFAPLEVAGAPLVLVAVFDRGSTLGLVRLFAERFIEAAERMRPSSGTLRASDAASFESDLEAALRRVFPEART